MPELGGLEREFRHTRVVRDLQRTPGDPRIAGALGEVDVGLGRELRVAALRSDFAEQQFVQNGLGQLLVGESLRRLGGDRLRRRQCSGEQQRGRQNILPQDWGYCDHLPS